MTIDSAEPRLPAKDLHPGHEFVLGSFTPSREETVEFASPWDPLDIHIDVDFARAGYFGDVVASGVHTLAIFQKLAVQALLTRCDVLAGIGLGEVKLPRPVLPDQTLTGRVTVQSVDLSGPDRVRVVREDVLLDGSDCAPADR